MNNSLDKEIIDKLKQLGGDQIQIPPNCLSATGGKFVDFEENKYLSAEFAINDAYNNPSGIMMGGYYGVFFDNVIGPMALMTGRKYCVSLDLNITFIKALKPQDKLVTVKAIVTSNSRQFVNLKVEAKNERGDILATGTSRMMKLG